MADHMSEVLAALLRGCVEGSKVAMRELPIATDPPLVAFRMTLKHQNITDIFERCARELLKAYPALLRDAANEAANDVVANAFNLADQRQFGEALAVVDEIYGYVSSGRKGYLTRVRNLILAKQADNQRAVAQLILQAISLLKNGDCDGAVHLCDEAETLKGAPDWRATELREEALEAWAQTHVDRARSFMLCGAWQQATTHLESALKLVPHFGPAVCMWNFELRPNTAHAA